MRTPAAQRRATEIALTVVFAALAVLTLIGTW